MALPRQTSCRWSDSPQKLCGRTRKQTPDSPAELERVFELLSRVSRPASTTSGVEHFRLPAFSASSSRARPVIGQNQEAGFADSLSSAVCLLILWNLI